MRICCTPCWAWTHCVSNCMLGQRSNIRTYLHNYCTMHKHARNDSVMAAVRESKQKPYSTSTNPLLQWCVTASYMYLQSWYIEHMYWLYFVEKLNHCICHVYVLFSNWCNGWFSIISAVASRAVANTAGIFGVPLGVDALLPGLVSSNRSWCKYIRFWNQIPHLHQLLGFPYMEYLLDSGSHFYNCVVLVCILWVLHEWGLPWNCLGVEEWFIRLPELFQPRWNLVV